MEVILKIPTKGVAFSIKNKDAKEKLLKQLSFHAEKNATCVINGKTYYTLYSYLKHKLVNVNKHSENSFHELLGLNKEAKKNFNLEKFLSAIINEISILVPAEINPDLRKLLDNEGTYPSLAFMNISTIVNHKTITELEANYALADDLYLYHYAKYYYPARFYVLDKTLFIEYVEQNNKY